MAMTTLVREVLQRASTLLNDIDPQFLRWKEADMIRWLNEGQRAVAKFVPIAGARIDTIKLAVGARQSIATIPAASIIPGDGSLPEDVQGLFLNEITRNMGADGRTPGAVVTVVSRELLDASSRMWHTTRPAKAIDHFTFDPRNPQAFYVFPPAGDACWVEANLVVAPKNIPLPSTAGEYAHDGISARTLSLDDRWADDVLAYLLARAFMVESDQQFGAQQVQLYSSMFTGSINAQVQALTGNNPNLRTLPLVPEIPAAAS